jgi:hypothetical protein
MDWRIKLFSQKLVDILPGNLGLKINFAIQRRMGNVGKLNKEKLLLRGIDSIKFLQSRANYKFQGSKVLEVGTGWHANDILLFYMLGVAEIYTCDHLPHLQENLALSAVRIIGSHLDILSKQCDTDINLLQKRFDRIASIKTLTDLLYACNINYIASQKLHEINFPESYFDLFFSRSVLQRVPISDLSAYLQNAYRALRIGGISYHIIHHADHNARHDDKLEALHYLRYGDKLYDLLQSKRFNYQNRMRHKEFINLFKQFGFEQISDETASLDLSLANKVVLSSRFRSIPLEDVLITRTQLINKRI